MRAWYFAAAAFVIAAGGAYGCSGSSSGSGFNGNGNGNGNGSGDGGPDFNGDANLGGGGDGSTGGGKNCSAAAMLVYVLSAENDLYSFSPPHKKFTHIGKLGCQTSMQPNSMAV